MSWNPHMEVHYVNTSYPYSTAGSFMEYFEGLTYDHVNFIFSGASHAQVLHVSCVCLFLSMKYRETIFIGFKNRKEKNDYLTLQPLFFWRASAVLARAHWRFFYMLLTTI